MNKTHLFLKPTTILGLVITLLFISPLKLNAQGPNSPEAASFEPIDATDMVNLITGDFTYVLPVLNVPSPEGGYPLALAYHAGIAMDQEASWAGLGWNLNAGAINRSVNGYPDDYKNSLLSEYFYSEGDEESIYSLSIGFSNYSGFSVGLGTSWGSNRSLGGYVSVGYGFDLGRDNVLGGTLRAGTNGVGVNLGLTTSGGLSLGVGASTNGGLNGSLGFDNNGTGFSISSNGSVNISLAQESGNANTMSLGITLSSNAVGINAGAINKNATTNKVDGGAGAGINLQFENTRSMGDYATKTSGWQIPITIPTPIGVFSLSFGKQKFRYYLGKKESNYVNGSIHFNQVLENRTWVVNCYGEGQCFAEGYHYFDTYEAALAYNNQQESVCANCDIYSHVAFQDIYEFPLIDTSNLDDSTIADLSNPTFPNYDKYNVQAQGLSGGMSSRLFENGNLFGLANKDNNQGYKLRYALNGSTIGLPDHARFNSSPYFYFDNEISSYLGVADVSEANFNNLTTNSSILDYYANDNSVELNAKPRRKNSTFIEYFTNQEIKDNYSLVKSKGYLYPDSGFDINSANLPLDGIGAFMVTAIDGKTYHYSLPVYNHETVTRTFGTIAASPNENQSYFEKRQLEPYATHWLLTAVTGPDYFDTNNNGVADKDDYGYWTTFEYGKWSDAFVWKAPYGKDYFENEDNNNIKTSIKGRKQVYYLDRVKTRTHTALFIKSLRNDALSTAWNYESVNHLDNIDQTSSAFLSRFNIPEQEQLKLDKIILVKEGFDNINKAYGATNQNYVSINYNNSSKPVEQAWYNLKDNILDVGDNINSIIPDAIKIIDLQYDNSLAVGRPNTNGPSYGSLTLKEVRFKGKGGEQLMPPYSFDYINNTSYSYNIDDKDTFGYYKDNNSLWSLNQITTPQGGKIQVNYEDNNFYSVMPHKLMFGNDIDNTITYTGSDSDGHLLFNLASNSIILEVGDIIDVTSVKVLSCYLTQGDSWPIYVRNFSGTAEVTQVNGTQFVVRSTTPGVVNSDYCPGTSTVLINKNTATIYSNPNSLFSGGIRVANLITTDGINSYRTEYNYGENENGVGHISYLPFAPELEEELPYSSELPAPRVMYEYVTMESFGTNNQSEGKIQYKFKVLKEKDPNDIKFGDLYEIDVTSQEHTNNVANKEVSINKYTVKDNLATLGQLLEVSTYNNEGQTLSTIENTYYSPDVPTPNQIGVTKEAYQTYKIADYINNTPTKKDKWLINSSVRIKYPSILKSSTEYKSSYEFTSQFGELDVVTGQANEIFSIASDGTEIKFKSIPAYHKYSQMGSKVDNVTNKNMLTQEVMSKAYIKVGNDWKETGVGITTWNNDWSYTDYAGVTTQEIAANKKIWRKHKSFVWDGELDVDGTLLNFNGEDDNFNWAVGQNEAQTNSKWKNTSTITKYDHYSMPLEARDINTNYASTKMDKNHEKILSTSNAAYTEQYYSGAEEGNNSWVGGQIAIWNYVDVYAHTGKYSEKAGVGSKNFKCNPKPILKSGQLNKRFKISVWVKEDNYTNARLYNGTSLVSFTGETVFAGDWVQLNHYVDLSTQTEIYVTSNSGYVYYDDFRLHPVASSMTSYVYNEWDELSFILDSNNLGTQYIYDEAGRLKETYKEVIDNSSGLVGGFKRVSENFYNYKNQ